MFEQPLTQAFTCILIGGSPETWAECGGRGCCHPDSWDWAHTVPKPLRLPGRGGNYSPGSHIPRMFALVPNILIPWLRWWERFYVGKCIFCGVSGGPITAVVQTPGYTWLWTANAQGSLRTQAPLQGTAVNTQRKKVSTKPWLSTFLTAF